MIYLRQPSLVLTSYDARNAPKVTGWATWSMPFGIQPLAVVHGILYYRDHTPELMLPNVLINCHAWHGLLNVGGRSGKYGFDISDYIHSGNADLFGELRFKDIGTIWLKGCNAANRMDGK